jgi:hypothetical protein
MAMAMEVEVAMAGPDPKQNKNRKGDMRRVERAKKASAWWECKARPWIEKMGMRRRGTI